MLDFVRGVAVAPTERTVQAHLGPLDFLEVTRGMWGHAKMVRAPFAGRDNANYTEVGEVRYLSEIVGNFPVLKVRPH